MDWYEQIEAHIRPIVKLLRDNGFNTTSSCHHDMTIDMDWLDPLDIQRLPVVLIENGITNFRVTADIDVMECGCRNCSMCVKFWDKERVKRFSEEATDALP